MRIKAQTTKYSDGSVNLYFQRKCYIEVYGWTVQFIYSDDIVQTRRSPKFVKLLGPDEGSGHSYAFVEHRMKKGNMVSWVFLPFDQKTGGTCPESIQAHECFHVAFTITEETGIRDEEAIAYLLQLLVSHSSCLAKDVYESMKKILTPEATAATI